MHNHETKAYMQYTVFTVITLNTGTDRPEQTVKNQNAACDQGRHFATPPALFLTNQQVVRLVQILGQVW